jgi:ubiquinone/menaquinone biosynthesis C-methylase UbiE
MAEAKIDLKSEEHRRAEFNQWALDGVGEQMERLHRSRALPAAAWLDLKPGERVLDLGCGTGWATRLLAEAVLGGEGSASGLDLSPEMIARARAESREAENVLFAVGSADEIPWRDEYFHKALCVESFYFFPEPSSVLRELHRVLLPGGRLAMVVSVYRENAPSLERAAQLKIPVQAHSESGYQQMLEAEGFVDVAVEHLPDSGGHDEPWPGGFAGEEKLGEFRRMGALLVTARKP